MHLADKATGINAKNMHKLVYSVSYQIFDRGFNYPVKSEEITVPKAGSVETEVQKKLKRDRLAMDLTRNFKVNIISKTIIGYSN